MYLYLSKVLPLLVMPLAIVLAAALLAFVMTLRGKNKVAASSLALAIGTLWLASMPAVATGLYRHLESQFPPMPLSDVPVSACSILLGGSLGSATPPRIDIELGEAVDRVYKAAELYRAGKSPVVIVSAGNQPWAEPGPPEAELLSQLLQEWGVPKGAIVLESNSRNTRENAINSKSLVESIDCRRPLLVTSAAHMPRAVAAFAAVGVEVFPVSTDIRVAGPGRFRFVALLPDVHAMAMTSDALRELIGQRVYRMQGWN